MRLLIPLLFMLALSPMVEAYSEGKGISHKIREIEDPADWVESPQSIPNLDEAPIWQPVIMPITIRQSVQINRRDLQLGSDQVIRYTLRQVSTSGIENISREGLHCNQRIYRSYAFADLRGKRWIESSKSQWRKLSTEHVMLREIVNALCPQGWAPANIEEVTTNLAKAGSAQ